ncbi:hypothetical protein HQN90_20495 [Paenibacillus alba]|uniref:hypothetical protein n=1 Tax=Paenibacillus alba TaxID=1197127 RepID=UPI001564C6AB|nr:hypothetical protein [Paenibacillus alba]NQX68508.1 hypothetical protein [Paenibacillus alba]
MDKEKYLSVLKLKNAIELVAKKKKIDEVKKTKKIQVQNASYTNLENTTIPNNEAVISKWAGIGCIVVIILIIIIVFGSCL